MIDLELARLPEKYREANGPLATSKSSPARASPSDWAGRSALCEAAWRGQEISSAHG